MDDEEPKDGTEQREQPLTAGDVVRGVIAALAPVAQAAGLTVESVVDGCDPNLLAPVVGRQLGSRCRGGARIDGASPSALLRDLRAATSTPIYQLVSFTPVVDGAIDVITGNLTTPDAHELFGEGVFDEVPEEAPWSELDPSWELEPEAAVSWAEVEPALLATHFDGRVLEHVQVLQDLHLQRSWPEPSFAVRPGGWRLTFGPGRVLWVGEHLGGMAEMALMTLR